MFKILFASILLASTTALAESEYVVQMISPDRAAVLDRAPSIVFFMKCQSGGSTGGPYKISCPAGDNTGNEFTATLQYDSSEDQFGGFPESAQLKFSDGTTFKMACSADGDLSGNPRFDHFMCD
jgi:hypothetical protein